MSEPTASPELPLSVLDLAPVGRGSTPADALRNSIALVQEEVRPDQRVMAGALLLLVMNFIGLGLGPTYVGAASDYFQAAHPEHSLQIALYTLTPFYVVAIVLFLWLARILRREQNAGVSA